MRECRVLNNIAKGPGRRTSTERVTGETPDISEDVDFQFYDTVWFWDHPHDPDNPYLGKWLGPSHRVGGPMCYYILKENGQVVSRTTVQNLTEEERKDDRISQKITKLTTELEQRLKDTNFILEETGENKLWAMDEDLSGQEYSSDTDSGLSNDSDREYTTDAFDPYLGAEFVISNGSGQIKSRVIKLRKGIDSKPIGKDNSIPISNTRLY